MFGVRGLSIIVVILALLSVALGWQVYSMRQSAVGQTNVLSQRLADKDTELVKTRDAINRANQFYLDVSKERVWRVRLGQRVVAREIAISIVPQVNGTAVRMAVALQPPLFGGSSQRPVRVLTTAPNWGADDKVLPVKGGVVRLQYQFPTAVTEATISLAP